MEDSTLTKYFDDLTEKIDDLRETVKEIDRRQSGQYRKIIEHGKELGYLKEKIEEEKIKDKDKFDIVHNKFRNNEKNSKFWFMAIISVSSVIAGVIGFFVPK